MRTSMFLLATCLFALPACGGDDSDDSSDNSDSVSDNNEAGGTGGSGTTQGGDVEAQSGSGASSEGAGAGAQTGTAGSGSQDPAAQGGSGGSSTTEVAEVPGSTKLSEITTDEQANGLCVQLSESLSDLDLDKITSGTCTLQGLVAELSSQGQTTCETARDQCQTQDSSSTSDEFVGCKASDFPKCADVTVDEYLACQHAQAAVYIDYFGSVTCDTDPNSLGETPAVPEDCTGVYERCPELGGTTEASSQTKA